MLHLWLYFEDISVFLLSKILNYETIEIFLKNTFDFLKRKKLERISFQFILNIYNVFFALFILTTFFSPIFECH